MSKYHLITYHPECGEDDKEDLNTMKEVCTYSKNYILSGYEKVFVFSCHHLVKVFDEFCKGGRKPYLHEINN